MGDVLLVVSQSWAWLRGRRVIIVKVCCVIRAGGSGKSVGYLGFYFLLHTPFCFIPFHGQGLIYLSI